MNSICCFVQQVRTQNTQSSVEALIWQEAWKTKTKKKDSNFKKRSNKRKWKHSHSLKNNNKFQVNTYKSNSNSKHTKNLTKWKWMLMLYHCKLLYSIEKVWVDSIVWGWYEKIYEISNFRILIVEEYRGWWMNT